MSIIFGSNSIQKVYFGSEEADKVYFGSDLVYQAVAPTPEFVRFDVPGIYTFIWPWDTQATITLVGGAGGRGGGFNIDPSLTPTSQHLRVNPDFGGSIAFGGYGGTQHPNSSRNGLQGGEGYDLLGSGGGGGSAVEVSGADSGSGTSKTASGGNGGAGQEPPAGRSYGYAGEPGEHITTISQGVSLGDEVFVRIGSGGAGGILDADTVQTLETLGDAGETGYVVFTRQ